MRASFLAPAAIAAVVYAPTLLAHSDCDDDHCVYWHDSAGNYVTDSSGDCVRTGSWRPGTQIPGCDLIKPKDADGDGVEDGQDQCPATPAGVAVDARGCALDTDNDGVADHRDACPGTPAGASVNARGCALDSDNDGVADHRDRCPDTPAGANVNARGCALDTDKDGVADHMDSCPDTRPGATVNAKGCAVPQFESASVDLDVNFASNSAEIRSEYATQMQALAHILKSDPNAQVTIHGHTDSVGNADYNLDLSQRRAEAVMNSLIANYGVSAAQVEAVGHGESQPLVDNSTAAGRAKNRRVEAEVSGRIPR